MILVAAIIIFGIQPGWITRWSEPTIVAALHPPALVATLNPSASHD
jgi:NAD(P)H-quinone oxidoreductase subunit 4